MSQDVVATWEVPLPDGVHKVEFQHGTATGKRVILVDDKVSSNKYFQWRTEGGGGRGGSYPLPKAIFEHSSF